MSGGGMMSGLGSTDDSGNSAIEGARSVDVLAEDFRFLPDRIVVSSGGPVNLALDNQGGLFHDLAIPDLGFRIAAASGAQVSGGLELLEPGEYPFECTVPGHAAAGMIGVLIVTP